MCLLAVCCDFHLAKNMSVCVLTKERNVPIESAKHSQEITDIGLTHFLNVFFDERMIWKKGVTLLNQVLCIDVKPPFYRGGNGPYTYYYCSSGTIVTILRVNCLSELYTTQYSLYKWEQNFTHPIYKILHKLPWWSKPWEEQGWPNLVHVNFLQNYKL